MSKKSMQEGHEGNLTEKIEKKTSRLPSLNWLGLAIGSMAASAALEFFLDRRKANLGTFVGLWAPSFLIIGLYNKLVKVEGSNRYDSGKEVAA